MPQGRGDVWHFRLQEGGSKWNGRSPARAHHSEGVAASSDEHRAMGQGLAADDGEVSLRQCNSGGHNQIQ